MALSDFQKKAASLAFLTFISTVGPLITRHVRIRQVDVLFSTSGFVVVNEIIKIILCIFIVIGSEKSVQKFGALFWTSIIQEPMLTLKAAIPGALYTLQNNLFYIALSNLNPAIFCVTYQLKTLATAFFVVKMLKKELRRLQYVSLVILVIGVSMVEVESHKSQKSPTHAGSKDPAAQTISIPYQNHVLGLSAVMTMCLSSSFAGVYMEKIFKESPNTVYFENIRLGIFMIPFSIFTMFVNDWKNVHERGFFAGYDWLVWSLILFGAFGGLSIALVMKYAGNIQKNYVQCLAIIFTAFGSIIWFDLHPTALFMIGCLAVMGSILLYNYKPDAERSILPLTINFKKFWEYMPVPKEVVVLNGDVEADKPLRDGSRG